MTDPITNHPDYEKMPRMLNEQWPPVRDVSDPVARELQALRKEVRSMFGYCMWVALGFSVLLLFLFLKG